MPPEVIFGMSNIRKKFKVSREYVYQISEKYENSPFKKIDGQWVCIVEDVAQFIRTFKHEKEKE